MFREFAKYIDEKYDASFLTSAAKKDAKKLAELLYFETAEFFENFAINVSSQNIFESTHYRKFFMREIIRVIQQYLHSDSVDDLQKKIVYRAYYAVKEIYAQKQAMLRNRSRSAVLDLILAVFDISSEHEISRMYVTVKALQGKLDPIVYKKLRERAKKEFGSCRIDARYFLYILRRIEEFENELANEEEKQETENMELTKADKIEKKNRKIHENVEIRTSETDFKKYTKGEKLTKETKYKLYIYRKMYESELKNTKLSRLSKDDLLFFLINVEKLIENQVINIEKAINIIKYADSNPKIKNPRGWLIERFSISRGRFYFLLKKSKSENENHVEKEKHQRKEHRDFQNQKQKQDNSVYIKEDLLYFAKKYSVPPSKISKYVDSLRLRGDVSIAVEQYLTSWLWKNYLSREEKQKLIQHARREIRKFVVPPKPEEIESYMKSIIRNEIRSRYLTLSIEDKIRLFSRKQHSNLQQHYDTS